MPEKQLCPPSSTLYDFIDGRIVDPDLSALAHHLEACTECQSIAKTLGSTDTLIDSLRGEKTPTERISDRLPKHLTDMLKLIPTMDLNSKLSSPGISRDGTGGLADTDVNFLNPPLQQDELGRLGPYRVLQVLGRGGMGIVFLAEDPKLGRRVALKVMLPRIARIPAAHDRFLREAKAAARLKNDHIVTVHQVDEINGIPFLAMELLQGETLEEAIQTGRRFSIAETIRIARHIARGLADAHEKGLVHRDIKPANLWLEITREGGMRVKVLDFGLACAAVDDVHITEFGTIVGTPAFMAPEQARADRAVDSRADLFSLGCVLYVLCTGEIPFKADTTVGTLMALALNNPVPPNQRNESVPAKLSGLIMELLEKDPANRPSSARDVIERLRLIEQCITASTTTTGAFGQTLLGNSKPMSTPPAVVNQPVRKSTGRGVKFAVGSFMLGLLLLTAQVLFWPIPDGKVVRIECNDPSIMVAFGGGELKVTGAFDQPVTLTPGKVDLLITKPQPDGEDFVFETDKLVVRKGDQIVLKIEVLDGEVRIVQDGQGIVDSKSLPSEMSLESIADKDRRATMWVLSIGGMVAIEMLADDGNIIDNTYREIHRVVEIPQEPFLVKDVYFPKNAALNDAGFIHFRDLRNLQMLVIDGAFERVTDAAIENLRGCTRLGRIQAQGCGISDKALELLKDLPALTYLGIGGKPGLTDAGLVTLKSFPALTKLYIGGANLTDAGLRHFSDFRNLQSLGLGGISGFTDEGLAHVADMKTLMILDLAATNAGDATIKRLSENPNLTDLSISYTKVTDEGFAHLQAIKGLKVIWVRDTRVTANAIESFRAAVPECRIEYGFDNPFVPNTTGSQD